MNIEDLVEGTQVTVTAKLGINSIDFKTTVAMKIGNTILVEEIVNDEGNAVSFVSDKLYLEMTSINAGGKPIIWKHVGIKHINYLGNSYHMIAQSSEGKAMNRRNAYRVYAGRVATVQVGMHKKAIEVMLKDVCTYGFAFVTEQDLEINADDFVRMMCDWDDFTINMTASIVRKSKVPNSNRFIYGCSCKHYDKILDKFLTQKQSEQIRKARQPGRRV